jgi:hypothetical protein
MAALPHANLITEQSSFIHPTSAMYPKPTAAFAVRPTAPKSSRGSSASRDSGGGAGVKVDEGRGGARGGADLDVDDADSAFQCYLLASGGEPSCSTAAGRPGCS